MTRRPRLWMVTGVAAMAGVLASAPMTPVRAVQAPFASVVVEAQPLLAQVRRVELAMEAAGSPLPAEAGMRLREAERAGTDGATARAVQAALDPFCLAEVRVREDGATEVRRGQAQPGLYEQGWRLFLVKVLNDAGATTTLRVTSPNAQDVPNGPAEAVLRRWLDLRTVDDRPLNPTLSGLALEYRLLQVYARDAGELSTRLFFNVGRLQLPSSAEGSGPRPVVQTWTFDRDVEGWNAQNQCSLEARDGTLRVTSTGNDPFMAARVDAPGGRMVVRFRARVERDTLGQVFWWTQDRPSPDGERMKIFPLQAGAGQWRSYAASFTVTGRMQGLRIDPGMTPGLVEIDDLSLAYEDEPAPLSAVLPISFVSTPSQVVKFDVRDEHGKPATAGFVIRDRQARVYPAQPKRLAPDFFFQAQIYRAHGESVRLPAGEYSVGCSRGPESIPETRALTVRAGAPAELRYQVRRWIDPALRGWYSGDHHIHAAGCAHYTSPTEGVHPPDMLRHIMGEDLKVGANLTWGPCFDYQKQFFKGKVDPISKHPYLLRYDIEVSGFGSHQSGHLCLLRLKDQMYPGGSSKDHWPTLGLNTLRWAKKQGAVCGPAHSSLGLTPTRDRVAGTDGPNGLPNFAIPAYNGIGANEFIVDVTHRVPGPAGKLVPAVDFLSTMNTDRTVELNMWYHVLNCGFRTRISGETDFPCVSAERVGLGRVYVKQSGKLSYDDWCEGIRQGRSYVSDGYHHLMDLEAYPLSGGSQRARVGERGSELKLNQAGPVRFRARFSARRPDNRPVIVELVVNGYPVAKTTLAGDGETRDVALDASISRSSWAALRIFPNAHTNPIFVMVGGKPLAPSPRSAEWCLRGVDRCWSEKERFYAPAEKLQAQQAYEHARQEYRRMLREAGRLAALVRRTP